MITHKLTESEINALANEIEPLCNGDTSDLRDWIAEGVRAESIIGYTPEQIADEWNELTEQAEDN